MREGAVTSLRVLRAPKSGRNENPRLPPVPLHSADFRIAGMTPAPPGWGLTCPCTSTRLGFCELGDQECSCCTLDARRARDLCPQAAGVQAAWAVGERAGALLVQVDESFLSAPARPPLPAQGARAAVCCSNYRVQSGGPGRPHVGFSDSLSLSSNYPRILEEGSLPSSPLPA